MFSAKVFVSSCCGIVAGALLLVGIAWAENILTVDRDGTVRMVITDTGNVGIGTTIPEQKLHLGGTGATRVIVQDTQGGGYARLVASGADAFVGSNHVTGKLFFQSGAAVNQVAIDSAGNMGIGTFDPKTKLHVTGLPEYADNAAAVAAGLTAGAFYRTGDVLKVVH